MSTGDTTQAPKPKAGTNQRFDLVDHQIIADAFKAFVDATHRGLLSTPLAASGVPTGELWVGSITANPSALDGLVRVDSALFAGLDADGGLVLVPDSTALTTAIPDDSSDYQVYLYTAGVDENSQVRRFLPAAAPYTEFAQAQNVHIRDTALLFTRAGGAGSVVADDVAGGITRPLLFVGIANNTGGAVSFTPAANRLETVTVPANLPASSTGDVAGTTFSSGDQATLRGMLNAAMHAIARDRWLGSNNYTPSATNNYGAYSEVPEGLDVAVRKHIDFITIGEDASSSFGTFSRAAYASDDLLLVAAIAALPSTGGTIYIKPGFTLDNFAANVTIPADTRVKFMSDVRRSLARVTFDMGDYAFVCASGGTLGALEFENCTLLTTSATTDSNIIELHDAFEFKMRGCFLAVQTVNVADPVALITVNAATVNLRDIYIEDTSVSHTTANVSSDAARYFLDTGVVNADTVLVQNCSIACQGDSTAGFGGRVINIADAGRDVRVLDCQFATLGETTPSGADLTALWLASATFVEGDYENRVVQNCGFRGRTTGGLSRNLQAILAVDLKNFTVDRCNFEQCTAGVILASGFVTGRLDTHITNSHFNICGAAIDTNFGNDVTGIKVVGNTLNESHLRILETADNVSEVLISTNTLVNSQCKVWGFVLTDVLVDNNLFVVEGTSEIPAPEIGRDSALSTLVNARFTNNIVRGYNTLTDNDFVFGVTMLANSLRNIVVQGNTFDNLQDTLTWTGAGNTDNTHNVVRILGNTTIGPVVVDGNTFSNIGTSITDSGGGKQWMPWLVFMGNINRDSGGCAWGAVSISNNVASACAVQLLYAHDMSMATFNMDSNNFLYTASALGDWANDVNIDAITASGSYGPVSINNNVFRRIGESGVVIQSTGTVGVIDKVTMTGNVFDIGILSDAGGVIVKFDANPMTYLIFRDNYCDIASSELDLAATPPTDSTPTTPSSGAYPDNINIVRV